MFEVTDKDIDELVAEHNSQLNDACKHWKFDEKRRHLFKSWDDVQACPGSGKTTLVSAKLLILAKKWKEPHQGICVLTHTNVARDEIISKLYNHSSGSKLTSYPHFIGTIQEFVNKFLGLPYIRNKYEFKRFIEDGEGYFAIKTIGASGYDIDALCRNLYPLFIQPNKKISYVDIKKYLGSLHYTNSNNDLRFFKQNASKENSLATSPSQRRIMLSELKEAMCNIGIFQYRDMYAFADMLLQADPSVSLILKRRFPIVLIDEMQDTQKYQDDLINTIFNDDSVCLQRFGDPDQAIFDGIGGEEPNESYNDKEGLYEITSTHRFGNDICNKIIGLSSNKISELTTDMEIMGEICKHTIFIYDDDTQVNVLEAFGELIAEADPDKNWKTVKAVGGVDGQSGHIKKYWDKFDKNKSAKSPRLKRLIQIIRLCQTQSKGHVSHNYTLLLQGVVDLLRKADIKTKNKQRKLVYFSIQSLIYWLKEKGEYHSFRKILTSWLLSHELTLQGWEEQLSNLALLVGLTYPNDKEEVIDYLNFDDAEVGEQVEACNSYKCENGHKIEVATIHSVKGETHDATLVLETKYRQNDIQQILPNLIDIKKNAPTTVTKKAFMRKLYVATSRPRYLLCLALHKDNITEEQIASLQELGWSTEILE